MQDQEGQNSYAASGPLRQEDNQCWVGGQEAHVEAAWGGTGILKPLLSSYLCTPYCVSLDKPICLSGPQFLHFFSDPRRNF